MKGTIHTETDRAGLIELVNKLDLAKPYSWEVKRKVIRRSISQNRLERLWLACISEEVGDDPNSLHDIFKEMFLEPKTIEQFGVVKIVYSSKDLNTLQFDTFLKRIQAKVAEYGIILPTPEDLIWESFYDRYKDRT